MGEAICAACGPVSYRTGAVIGELCDDCGGELRALTPDDSVSCTEGCRWTGAAKDTESGRCPQCGYETEWAALLREEVGHE